MAQEKPAASARGRLAPTASPGEACRYFHRWNAGRPGGTSRRAGDPTLVPEPIMKFIVEVTFPLEPFSTYVRKGEAGPKIAEVLGSIQPEVMYFTDSGTGRGAVMIVDLADASQVPHVTEPLMLNFDAAVHYRIAMSPEDLQAAGLDKYANM